MKKLSLFLIIYIFFVGCKSSSSGTDDGPTLRIISTSFSLEMSHNSHFDQAFTDESNSYSVTASIELFLSEDTNYLDIESIHIIDKDSIGWDFSKEEIAESYGKTFNSLRLEDLELKRFKAIHDNPFKARLLNKESEIASEKGFELANDLPLPASTSYSWENENTLRVNYEFYNTPFDGGTIPFPIDIYDTPGSIISLSIIWLNSNKEIITEKGLDTNLFEESEEPNPNDLYHFDYALSEVPEGAAYFYTKLIKGNILSGIRGSMLSGRVLNTQILEFAPE